jgi:signal transduction histidine kinase
MMHPRDTSILLVEDNLGDARLIQEMLRGVPEFCIATEETLADGINAALRADHDLILLDLSLPDSSGLDTVQRMKAEVVTTPIVVLTGFDDEQQGRDAVQAGAQDYLIKGDTNSRVLERAIRYALQRHEAEEVLRRSEGEYRSLIEDVFATSALGVIILDRFLTVVWLNEATEVYFGIERAEILGQDKRVLVDNKLKCVFEDPDDYSSRLFKAYDDNDFTDIFECHVTPGAGREERWLQHWSQPIHAGMYAGGRIEHYMDITARKQAEFAMRELAALQERQRLARDLHDSVNQTLFSAQTMAEAALRQWTNRPERAQGYLGEVHHMLGQALAEMRLLLLELRPSSLIQVGLRELFEQYLRATVSPHKIDMLLDVQDIAPLPPDAQIALYRIVQEAVNNVVKHADARRIIVRAVENDGKLTLSVSDDGRGFAPADRQATSLGLDIMQERASMIGAELTINSTQGSGTQINITWNRDKG